jgi:hypothetical protein
MPDRKQGHKVFSKNLAMLHHIAELTTEASAVSSPIGAAAPLKLIPWHDIWSTLKVARVRGNGEMIEVFYDTLFKEAVFDDQGAWSLDLKSRR